VNYAAGIAAGWHWPDAQIVSVTDGDTIDCLVTKDVGFGGSCSFRVRLRLARINAPAKSSDAGKASAAWLTGLLTGQTVDLVTLDAYKYGGPQYSPGEWMCELTLADGRNVSDLSVSLGFSVYWGGQGPRPGG
jgi:endonuclease YncB( thermonuclease family)